MTDETKKLLTVAQFKKKRYKVLGSIHKGMHVLKDAMSVSKNEVKITLSWPERSVVNIQRKILKAICIP